MITQSRESRSVWNYRGEGNHLYPKYSQKYQLFKAKAYLYLKKTYKKNTLVYSSQQFAYTSIDLVETEL